jgi:Spy/CpxP family protein refolding chaperone
MGHDNNVEASAITNSSTCPDLADSGFDLGGAADDDDDDASHYTSITLQLQSAAVKAVAHLKTHRAISVAVPLEVKEAMLEKEFPHVAGMHREQNYNDCIKTLSVSEVLHQRQAMYTYEKHRMVSIMQQLSTQMYAYQELLEENQRLKKGIIEVSGVKDDKISELENSIIDMKLELASYKSTEDHHRLRIAKLEYVCWWEKYGEENRGHYRNGENE